MHVSACLRLPCRFERSSTSTLLSINARHASKLTGLPIWLASCGAVARWRSVALRGTTSPPGAHHLALELTAQKAMRSAADDDAAGLRQAENERLQLGRWRRGWRGWRGR